MGMNNQQMGNQHIHKRLKELINIFKAVDDSGCALSSATKGAEREFFINNLLSNIIAPPFRIGNGDIVDSKGNRSGQLDIVIEYGNSISFPMLYPNAPRLYLAEGVCAVIEIKSDLSSQWDEVKKSHEKLALLERNYSATIFLGNVSKSAQKIPHFAVGYRGWKKEESLKKINDTELDGILILDSGNYIKKGGETLSGEKGLFEFFIVLTKLTGAMIGAVPVYEKYKNV